jgi:hypothetical protein
LGVIRDTATTCVNTARSHNREDTDELATVIHNHVMLDIDDQMRKVTECIELLGGRTKYSVGMRSPSDPDYAKYAAAAEDDDEDDDCDRCHCDCDEDEDEDHGVTIVVIKHDDAKG